MKWIERLFGKKEQPSPEIRLEELQGWLESKSKEIAKEAGRKAAPLYSEIGDALEEIKESTASLEEAEPEGRFHLKMVKTATSNRDNMVKQVRLLIENITVPENMDIKTILAFHENAMQTLTVCLENMMKSYQYAKLVFLDDSKEVITDVNKLGKLLNRLAESVKDEKNMLDAVEKAQETVQGIKDMRSAIELENISIKERGEKASMLEKEISEKRSTLSGLKNSQGWRQYLSSTDELSALENSAKKIESEINGMVLPLNKVLNRLKQLSESGRYTLAPDVREGLYLCLSDPKCVTPDFLAELKKIVESGALAVSSDKRDKMLEQIKLIDSSFDASKKKYQALAADIEKKKDEVSKLNVVAEERKLSEDIAALQDKLAWAQKELEVSKKHLESLADGVELKKQELQKLVSAIDRRVRVLF